MARKHHYQVFIKDVTVGSWTIEAEDEDKAREIADTRLMDGDTTWHISTPGDGGYIQIFEIEKLD
jgi:hypothetical protein